MRLKVFDVIDETLDILTRNHSTYVRLEQEISHTFEQLFQGQEDDIIDIYSRIKSKDSLREKIIRNRMYMENKDANAILNHLSDLIGFTIECRFIEDEFKILNHLRKVLVEVAEDGYCYHKDYPTVFLDIHSQQPQIQKNGFSIYRIDGYILEFGKKVNFELQIKALVNSFWGDIEHKLVYKNTNFYVYDEFMKDILSSIKANLAIIDRQLSIVFHQMSRSKASQTSLLNEMSFEMLLSKAINDIFATKMSQSIGFTMNLKQISTILGHYIFYKDIQNGGKRNDQVTSLFQSFKQLNSIVIDFEHEIELADTFESEDLFIDTLGRYLITIINEDYDWYVFLKMLFVIQPGNNMEDFNMFLFVIKRYMIDDYWLHTSFVKLPLADAKIVQNACAKILADSLCAIGDISIVYNEKMVQINKQFVHFIEHLEQEIGSLEEFEAQKFSIVQYWFHQMDLIFERNGNSICQLELE